MCRLLAISPNTSRKVAIDILANMVNKNVDGTGEAYIGPDGNFVVNKYSQSIDKVLKKGKKFLDHLPYAHGWTLIHIRQASIGFQSKENSHPFLSLNGEIVGAHNGTLGGTHLLSMYLQTCLGFSSQTDSACAVELISRMGMENFSNCISFGGNFISINKKGELEVAKISRELSLHYNEDGSCIISSEFDEEKYPSIEMHNGFFRFDKTGKCTKHVPARFDWKGYEKTVVSAQGWNGVHYQAPNAYQSNLPAVYGGHDNKRDQEMLGECWGC